VVATGIGETTGATYQINDLFHEDFESPSPPAPQVTITFQETIRVTGTAPGTGFTVREEFHLVLQPSSPDAKVTREVESVRADWQGSGGDSFQQVTAAWGNDQRRLLTALAETSTAIRTAGRVYTAADESAAQRMSSSITLPL